LAILSIATVANIAFCKNDLILESSSSLTKEIEDRADFESSSGVEPFDSFDCIEKMFVWQLFEVLSVQ